MSVFKVRSDLPLRGDASGRFVAMLVMVLVFVGALALTVNAYIGALLDNWNRSVTGTLTIQIPQSDARDGDVNAAVARAIDVLSRHPAVAHAEAVPRATVVELLKPWLGEGDGINDLPLPALIDVELKTSESTAIDAVSSSVKIAVPGAVIDDHRVWLTRVIGLANGLKAIAIAIMTLVTGALALTIVFATRASLTEFAQVIEILHVVGARDGYIAGQFARRALIQGLLGGLAGLVLYMPAFVLIAWLAGRVDAEILPRVQLTPVYWVTMGVLPFAAALLATVTANMTVRGTLATQV